MTTTWQTMRLRAGLALAVAILLWTPVAAQTEPLDDDSDPGDTTEAPEDGGDGFVESIEVDRAHIPSGNTVATKVPVPLQLTPANVGVVTRTLFEEQRAEVLGDTLHNVSSVHTESGSGVHDFFVIRGFDSLNGSMVMTDGVREPEVTYYQTYNIEGIEVLKGPAGYLYGSDPLAGVVNIVRKQPLPTSFARLTATAGSFGLFEGTLDWNHAASEATTFRLNGVWNRADNYRDDKSSRFVAANPSLTWRPDDRSSLNFNLEYVDAGYSPDSGIPLVDNDIPDVPRTTSYQSPFDRSDQNVGRFQVDYQNRVNDKLTARGKLFYRSLDWQSDGTVFVGVFPSPTDFSPQLARLLLALDDRQEFVGTNIEAVVVTNTGPVEHQLLGGLELARLTDRYTLSAGQLPFMSVYDPVETATEPPPLIPFDQLDPETPGAGDARSRVVAPYVVDQMKFSQKFQLMLGLRYDDIDYRDDLNGVSRDDSNASPMAGLVFSPSDALALYANAGRSHAPASPRVRGDLTPERSEQVEIGAKQKLWGDRGRLTVALYQLERRNIPIPDDLGFTQQAGDQRSRGFEIDFAAEPIPRLTTFLAYSYTDAELTSFTETGIVGFDPDTFQPIFGTLDRSGNRPPFVPEHLASLWVAYKFRRGLGLGGGARYFSDQYIAPDNEYLGPGALVLDAVVFYDYKGWRFRLNLQNLTDREYEMRGFGSASVLPANPFSAAAGVDVRF